MTETKSNHLRVALLALFLVLFIDGLGQGIMFPILAKTIIHGGSSLFGLHETASERMMMYSVIIAIFFVGWFFGGAILSDLSDTMGRKKALLICVFGSAIGYLLCGLSFYFRSVSMLILGRGIAGLTAGDQPIAQAAVIDLCPLEKRSVFIGYVMLAFTLGMVCGPIAGGFLSDSHLWHGFSDSTPMYFGMVLSGLAFIGLGWFFKEPNSHRRKVPIHIFRVFSVFVRAFHHKAVRYLLIAFAFMQFGWSVYWAYASVFLTQRYNFTTLQVSEYMALLGVGLAIGLGFLPRFFSHVRSHKWIVATGFGLLALMILVTAFCPVEWAVWIIVVPGTASFSLAYTSLMTLFSQQVDESLQGWVMGVSGAVIAFCCGTAAVAGGWLHGFGVVVPMISSAIITWVGCVLISLFRPTS